MKFKQRKVLPKYGRFFLKFLTYICSPYNTDYVTVKQTTAIMLVMGIIAV
jgi:hypothetical protein